MNHQITLEEFGIIPVHQKECCHDFTDRQKYAFFCGGCVCYHCANSVECSDNCTGEADFGCFACDDCKGWDGEGTDNWKPECRRYKITNAYAKVRRKQFHLVEERRNHFGNIELQHNQGSI